MTNNQSDKYLRWALHFYNFSSACIGAVAVLLVLGKFAGMLLFCLLGGLSALLAWHFAKKAESKL